MWITERTERFDSAAEAVLAKNRRYQSRVRAFDEDEFDRLVSLIRGADMVLPLREINRMPVERWPRKLLALRHDIDNDVDNAVTIAEREAKLGIRATFFVLHSDWYYFGENGRPTRHVFKALSRISDLGHEIGLHNNALGVALRSGDDPIHVLRRELKRLRRWGHDVVGTAAHGDRILREADRFNYELFEECPPPGTPKPDTISFTDQGTGEAKEQSFRRVSMRALGLEYEAGFLPNRYYLTDSGGYWRGFHFPPPTGFDGRYAEHLVPEQEVRDLFEREGGFIQVLNHPVWWAFDGQPVTRRKAAGD